MGVPIPIFYCKDCKKELINDDTIKAVAKLFAEKGSDAWYEYDAKDILPKVRNVNADAKNLPRKGHHGRMVRFRFQPCCRS